MKKSNKMKLLASLASLAVVATPIATLASCGCTKKAYIYIDESQKTKKLESGARGATYTFTLTDNIVSGDKIEAGTTDVSASQTGYTVNVLDVIYSVNSKEVKVVTAIQPTSNELLKEGASFSFGIAINRTGSKSWTNTITGFKMTYAVPTKTGLTIAEEAKTSYTNPAEAVHSYVFDVGSTISVDSECTFECDITKQESKTPEAPNLSVRFNKATPITDNKQLSANFELIYDDELQEGFKVTFDFTLSCIKNGVELWRQSFKDFTLEYMDHQMWIYSEYQWDCTYAGEHEFHIYVVKNKDLHWGGEYQIGIRLDGEQSSLLEVDEEHVVEGTTEQGTSYFDIPVSIDPTVVEDTIITYKPVLIWTQPGQSQSSKEFPEQSVTYHKTKITAKYDRTALETEHKSHIFSFKMEDEEATPTKVEVEEFTQIRGSQDTSISAIEAEIVEGQINVLTAISTNILDANAEFKFVIKGTTAEGKTWYQKIGDDTKPMKMYYVDPVTVLKKEVQTSLDEVTAVIPYQETREECVKNIGDPKNPQHSEDINDFHVEIKDGAIQVEIEPLEQLNYNSWVSFDLPFDYEIEQGGLISTGTKTITGLKVTYNGSVIFDEEEPQKVTSPGERTQNFKFKNLSGLTNITASIEKTGGYTGYELTAGTPTITRDEINLPITIDNTAEEYMDSGAYCEFKVTFKADGWTKTIDETFMLTYTSGYICNDREKIETEASKANANMQITAPSALKAGEKYSIAVSKNYSSEIKVTLGTLTVSGTTINQALTLSKSGGVLTDGDGTRFDIIIKKLNASGETLACERMQECKATYVAGDISWNREDSWYMYELDPSWPIPRTKAIPIKFTLRRPLSANQELRWDLSAAKAQTYITPMWKGDRVAQTDGTNAWFEIFFQKASGFTVGDYCWYDLTFTCVDTTTNETVWTKTIDWYLYMFAGLYIQQQEMTTQTMSADAVFDLTAKIPQAKFGGDIKFTPFIVKKSASKDNIKVSAGNLKLSEIEEESGEMKGKQLIQNLYFESGAAKDDWMVFDIKYLVNVKYDGAAYNAYITIENVKLTKTA